MSRTRTTRLLTVSVLTTLVAGLLALIGVGIGPAQAGHLDGVYLEVTREVSTWDVGTTATIQARLVTDAGLPADPTSDYSDVEIDFEIEGAAWDGENGARTASSPDRECITKERDDQEYPFCEITIKIDRAGNGLVRAWIDHDGRDGTELGGTEADFEETRYAGPTDCITEVGASLSENSPDPFNDCRTDPAGANAGRDEELDTTDVVRVIGDPGLPAVTVACPQSPTKGAIGQNITVVCTVADRLGTPKAGEYVDGRHMGGANDPGTGSSSATYETGPSDTQGQVAITVNGSGGQSDYATICAWVDTDASDENAVPNTLDNRYRSSSEAEEGDGGGCPEEAVPPSDSPRDYTDKFFVQWVERSLASLNVSPETARSTTGTTHTLTAQVFDNIGGAWNAPSTRVYFEFLSGSARDTDGSTLNTPDLTCDTPGDDKAGGNACTVSYTSAKTGTDTICAWIVTDNKVAVDSTCLGESQGGDEGGPEVDVVTKDWTATPSAETPEQAANQQGYVLVGGDGGIFTFGAARFHGSTGNLKLNQPIIGIAYMPGGEGYWLVARDGGVFTFGAAKFHGSMGDKTLNAPVLGMESTPSGNGYWLYAADGGIFTFGDAQFKGSTGDKKLNAPMIGMAVTEKGDGYWLVAQDGGVFTFNAPFFGSTGDKQLNQPVFDMAPAANDKGYWLVARDGGVFTFGDIDFYGSAANVPGRGTVIGMGDTPTGKGYWISDVNGKVMPFGDAKFFGDRSSSANNAPMVAFATVQPKG